jgi:hypothetical protein
LLKDAKTAQLAGAAYMRVAAYLFRKRPVPSISKKVIGRGMRVVLRSGGSRKNLYALKVPYRETRVLKNSGQPPPVGAFLPKLRKTAPICDFFNTLPIHS